jgi:hypothetical protein
MEDGEGATVWCLDSVRKKSLGEDCTMGSVREVEVM